MTSRGGKWLARLGSPLVVLLIPVVVVAIRGSWASNTPQDPAGPEDGIVRQLLRTAEGRTVTRAALVVNHPPEAVWARLTDFDHYSETFPTIRSMKFEAGPPAKASADVQTFWGVKHLSGKVTRDDTPARRVLAFEDMAGDANVHVARFIVAPHGSGQSLLVYEVDADVPGYPTVLVRNVLLSRNPTILAALRDALDKRPSP
jgi:carbon monoxide dehydrogenase subunit G